MKKRVIAASIAIMLLMPFILGGCDSQNPEGEGFAIYLTKGDIPVAQMEALSHVDIAATPLINIDDIVLYHAEPIIHYITVTPEAYERIRSMQVPTQGKSFVVCVDKVPIYWGAFWATYSSQSFDGVNIQVPPIAAADGGFLFIELGYPTKDFFTGEDPRLNPFIIESLEKAEKLWLLK